MNDLFNKELIAFQSVDKEGDIWCNVALLFESEQDVKDFFADPEKVIKVLDLELDRELGETIDTFMEVRTTKSGLVTSVRIQLEYCGTKHIARMQKGFLIKKD